MKELVENLGMEEARTYYLGYFGFLNMDDH